MRRKTLQISSKRIN